MREPVAVRVGDCACPDAPHTDGDIVYLDPVLSLEGGAAAEADIQMVQELPERRRTSALIGRWAVTYVVYGAVGWNWTELDERGKSVPRPFDVEVLLADYSRSRLVAEKADELYSEVVTAPFVARVKASRPSPGTPTAIRPSTSPASPKRQRKSASSSPPVSVGQPSVTAP